MGPSLLGRIFCLLTLGVLSKISVVAIFLFSTRPFVSGNSLCLLSGMSCFWECCFLLIFCFCSLRIRAIFLRCSVYGAEGIVPSLFAAWIQWFFSLVRGVMMGSPLQLSFTSLVGYPTPAWDD